MHASRILARGGTASLAPRVGIAGGGSVSLARRVGIAGGGTGRRTGSRRGTALVVCIFVISMTSVIVVSILDAEMLRLTALRNVSHYERALYLAGAAAHHALAELETAHAWRTGVSAADFPSGSGGAYSASVADSAPATVVVTASGTSGGVTRKLSVTVYLAN